MGAIVLTFLAGAELDPVVFKLKWKEAAAVGLASFFLPFLGCAAAAYYVLGWEPMPSWLAGVAMSTTSVAVVYAVMLEFGFNRTEYGKTVLAACFVTDLGTVVALGLIFAPFTLKTLVFLVVGAVVFLILPRLTPRFFKLYGDRPSELETKFLLLCLLGMGALANWADSEAVLPAYLIGMLLAGTVGKDHALIRRGYPHRDCKCALSAAPSVAVVPFGRDPNRNIRTPRCSGHVGSGRIAGDSLSACRR
jgi:glutathione-regulated potassium-efflux system ancillary protein KefC